MRGHAIGKLVPTSVLLVTAALTTLSPSPVRSQGCVVGRQCEQSVGNFLMPGQMDFTVGYRTFEANRHYNGTVEQKQRHTLNNYVINLQNNWDVNAQYGLTQRLSVGVDIPFVDSGWSIPIPIAPVPGPREQQRSSGVGDIVVGGKYWLFDPHQHEGSNVQMGLGIKAPTGDDRALSVFPNKDGTNRVEKPVDQSIQPGDGGWGISLSAQAFKELRPVTFFATWNYLVNPLDTNGVPSIRANIGIPPDPKAPSTQVNSVPDQYLYKVGVAAAMPVVPNLSGSLAFRVEGVPAKDLIGGNHGFRRPGYSESIEPGLSYASADTTFSLSVPFTIFRKRVPTVSDGVPVPGDATFADKQILFTVNHRFNTR